MNIQLHQFDDAMKESNKPDAENPARTSRLAIGCHWCGVSDPFRSPL